MNKIINLCRILQIPSGISIKYREEAFNLNEFETCQTLKNSGVNPATIFDIGANIGQFALAAAKTFPSAIIHSYEPIPAAFNKLSELSRHYGNIKPHCLALGEALGKREIHVTNHSQSSSFLHLHQNHKQAYPQVFETGTESISLSTLDEEIRSIKPKQPLLLKLDVQGYEGKVIEGAVEALEAVQWLLIECSSEPFYEGSIIFDELNDLLRKLNFAFTYPVCLHRNTRMGEVSQFDALFSKR